MKLKDSIGEDWFFYLAPFLKTEAFKKIEKSLAEELQKVNSTLVPSIESVFEAFKTCRYSELTTVLLNDCPAKELNTNDGIAFSSNRTIEEVPLETSEFFSGIENDIYDGFQLKQDYDYHRIAKQGVLMLNYSMTLSNRKLGLNMAEWSEHYEMWQPFIFYLIDSLCVHNKGLVFILIGKKPREFADLILRSANYLLTCTHPRDAVHFAQQWDSAGVFSITNQILTNNNNTIIKW